MRYVFDDLEKIRTGLAGKYLFLFLDCDGTLTPIVDTPDKAVILPKTKRLLGALSRKKGCRVAIISGRELGDIKKKFGLKGIIYSGNHGFQIQGPKIRYELAVSAGYKKILRLIQAQLEDKLTGIKGVFVENKKFSLVLHFRLADRQRVPLIKTVFHECVIFYLIRNKIKIRPGKEILEVMPPGRWDKGKIVAWLLARQEVLSKNGPILPVYIGDDATDEDAFKTLRANGFTVFVGQPGPSQAKYYVKNVQEVHKLLKYILDIRGIE